MTPLPSPLAIVCHDAGAANLVAAWAPGIAPADTRLVLQGPAIRCFAPVQVGQRFDALEAALDGAACVLTGSGWQSDLEHAARVLAKRAGVQSIAVLDHWVNYPERFERHGTQVLPDTIWVADAYALAIAREQLPAVPIALQPNTYVAQALARIAPVPPQGDVLVLLEPARSTWGRDRPGEFQALDYLLENLPALGAPAGTPLRLRLHPSEPPGKYDAWLRRAGIGQIDISGSLEEALSGARWVAGCETAALVVAMAAGRTAVSTLPPWAPPCRLPHDGLLHLKHLAPPVR